MTLALSVLWFAFAVSADWWCPVGRPRLVLRPPRGLPEPPPDPLAPLPASSSLRFGAHAAWSTKAPAPNQTSCRSGERRLSNRFLNSRADSMRALTAGRKAA